MLWLIAGAPLVTLLVLGLVFLLLSSAKKRDAALHLQEHSYDVMILAGRLDSAMARAEAKLGQFVVSGDRAIGRAYSEDWRQAGSILRRLRSTIGDNPEQASIVRALEASYAARGKELARAALRTTYKQNEQALAIYYRNGTSPELPKIDAQLRQLIAYERALLLRRTAEADARAAYTNALTAAISAVGLIMVIGAGLLGWTLVQGTVRRREEERRGDELEAAVAERTAELLAANNHLEAEMMSREGAEAQLRQIHKMDAVGQLTGGIAHDFNNMLAVVINGLELAKRRIGTTQQDAVRHIDSAMDGANRAAALTKRLLAFARAEPLLPILTDADVKILGMSEMLDRTLGDQIIVEIQSAASDWRVLVDQHQLENAILNLAVNSRDAMPQGGTLTIATRKAMLTRDTRPKGDGEFVCIDVTDTGCGIAPALLERVFEPFFTTKPAGKGTGLGLSQLFAFVRQSGGTIDILSTVGEGTTVSIFLPRSKARVRPASADDDHGGDESPAGSAVVLAVEDDRRVLAATVAALAELGHTPIACADVGEASRLLARHPEIDLIFSDVMMPGATGPELVASLRIQRPGIPVIYATGFAGDIADPAAFGDDPVLRKPFTISTLETAIARSLRGRAIEMV